MCDDRGVRFPLGSRVQLEALSRDPYPMLKALQEQEPVSWVAVAQAWFVTRRADCLAILLDSTTFSVASPSSLVEDALGQTMLSTDGMRQRQLRQPFNGPPAYVTARAARVLVGMLRCGFTTVRDVMWAEPTMGWHRPSKRVIWRGRASSLAAKRSRRREGMAIFAAQAGLRSLSLLLRLGSHL